MNHQDLNKKGAFFLHDPGNKTMHIQGQLNPVRSQSYSSVNANSFRAFAVFLFLIPRTMAPHLQAEELGDMLKWQGQGLRNSSPKI